MDSALPLGRSDNVELGQLLSHYEAPAFVRRDRRVREAFEGLLDRYYLLEKECAIRSARLARRGFRPLDPVTREELGARFPVLAIPACK